MGVTMEHRLYLHRWERRAPDWLAAVVAGFAAGAVLMVLELAWTALAGSDGPWRISQLVAALLLGPGTLQVSPYHFDVGVVVLALSTHYVLGVVFGMVLGFILAGFHYDTSLVAVPLIGAAFGAALYLFNFVALTQLFPWFAELRGWATFASHLVFGVSAALLYWQLARRGLGGKPGR
jgi:hypothetical protein